MSQLIFDEEKHLYTHDGQPIISVTQILQATGMIDFSMVRADVLDRACKLGTATHKATQFDDKGTLDEGSLSEGIVPYLNAWRKFKSDYNAYMLCDELMVHSHRYDFAGTLDRVAVINGKNILIDIKTSTAIYPATRLQTALYKIAYEEETGNKVDGRWCVQLKDDGTYKTEVYKNRTDEMYAISARKVYQFRKENNLL